MQEVLGHSLDRLDSKLVNGTRGWHETERCIKDEDRTSGPGRLISPLHTRNQQLRVRLVTGSDSVLG